MILRTMSWVDALDILLVAIPFYLIFTMLLQARSFLALWGIITLVAFSVLLYLLARTQGLQATAMIYERFWIIVVLIFLIVFQGEFKRGLADIGRLRLFRRLFHEEAQVIGEVIAAVQDMSQRRVGGLIVFERGTSLKAYLETGTLLDAVVTSEAIRAIFTPYSPLHDGALILRGSRLVAAGCILPLTDNPTLSRELGTRHRAAIGLTEETDALVAVVSEETGAISLAIGGRIERRLKPEELRRRLEEEMHVAAEEAETEELAHG